MFSLRELKDKVVRRWYVGTNSYYEFASYHLEEQRLPVYLLQEANWLLCGIIPDVDFPKDSELAEEYGSWNGWWHCKVCSPVFEYVNARTRHVALDTISLKEMRERHPEATAYLDDPDEDKDVCEDNERRSSMFRKTAESDGKIYGDL